MNPASARSKLTSIVIPTFNQAKYLPASVDHCLFQSYGQLEIIIVDGGSTDDTKQFLAGLEKEIAGKCCTPVKTVTGAGEIVRETVSTFPKDRILKIVTFEEDIGPTRTVNEGLRRVTGAYCTYVVGDDIPHPHMIEELVLALERTGADFAYSDMNVVDDSGRIVRQMRLPDYSFQSCFAQWFQLGVSRLYRTIWHEKAGFMDERYQGANDYDQYLRFAMSGAVFHHVPRILYSVRHHGPQRKTGQHTDERYANLLAESRQCAYRAREFLRIHSTVKKEALGDRKAFLDNIPRQDEVNELEGEDHLGPGDPFSRIRQRTMNQEIEKRAHHFHEDPSHQ